MSAQETQRTRLLRALRQAGTLGIHSLDMRSEYRVGNPSQRMIELMEAGHTITATRERPQGRAWGVRYRLIAEAPAARDITPPAAPVKGPAADPPTLTGEPASLFDYASLAAYSPFTEAA